MIRATFTDSCFLLVILVCTPGVRLLAQAGERPFIEGDNLSIGSSTGVVGMDSRTGDGSIIGDFDALHACLLAFRLCKSFVMALGSGVHGLDDHPCFATENMIR